MFPKSIDKQKFQREVPKAAIAAAIFTLSATAYAISAPPYFIGRVIGALNSTNGQERNKQPAENHGISLRTVAGFPDATSHSDIVVANRDLPPRLIRKL